MTLTALPIPPSRQDPANFSARADAFLAALPNFVSELNALLALLPAESAASLALALASPSAGQGSALVDFSGRGLTIGGTTYAPRFEATNTDDSGTPDAAFRANRVLSSGVSDGHGFRDQTTFSRVTESYAAFDAAIISAGSGTNDHIASFQSRPTINRSGGSLTNCFGFVSTVNLASGTLTNNFGFYPYNPTGAGTVLNNYGFYIPQQTKGSVLNYAGYIAQQAAPFFSGAPVQINNVLTVNPSAPLIIGGATTLAYPHLSYNYDPVADDKRVNDIAVSLKMDTLGLRVYAKPAGAPLGGTGMLASMTEGLRVDTTGAVFLPAVGTTAAAANAYINNGASNQVLRSTSSIRYKTDVQDVAADASARIWDLRPVRYRSLAQADNGGWSFYGLIAEEVAAVDPRLVHWSYRDDDWQQVERRTETPIEVDIGVVDVDGKPITRPDVEVTTETVTQLRDGAQLVPDGVQYERLAVLLLAEVRALRERVAALESQGAA